MEDTASAASNASTADSLYPDFVCRLGGVPADTLDSLRATASQGLVQQLLEVDDQLDEVRTVVSDELYTLIGNTNDREIRGALLQIRRDAYNLRPIDVDDLEMARPGMPDHVAEPVKRLLDLTEKQASLRADLADTFEREVAEARDQFQDLTQDPDFQRGLLISSQTLFELQDRYQDAEGADLTSKRARLERGLMRYFSRTAMKATPFGTFCAIVPGHIENDGDADETQRMDASDGSLRIEGDPQSKTSTIRLNKHLFGLLKAHLEKQEVVRRHLAVELNPTLRRDPEDEDTLLFLAEVNGSEVFQRLPHNPVLDIIEAILRERDHVPLAALARAIYEHPAIDATEAEVMPYVDRLIELGFLRFRWGISEQEVAWDRPLRRILDPIDDPEVNRIVETLEMLRDEANQYGPAGVTKRKQILDAVDEEITSLFADLRITTPLRTGMAFYEDATAAATASMRPEAMASISDATRRYIRATLAASYPRSEQVSMRHFYDSYYEDADAVPLLSFYEDFFREHFKAHLEKQRKMRLQRNQPDDDEEGSDNYNVQNPFELDALDGIMNVRSAVAKDVSKQWRDNPSARVLHVDASVLDDAMEEVPDAGMDTWSVSVFAQFAPPQSPEHDVSLIVPNGTYFAGYGKYFSRFLYLFPDAMRERIYDTNNDLTSQHLAEICGDAHFNANLHPPLIEKEISYPTGESGASDAQLRSSDIVVEPAPDDAHALWLRHAPSGRRVLPVDLGFLNPRMRPPLYQLLSRFTPIANYSMSIPNGPAAPEDEAPENDSDPDSPEMADTSSEADASSKDASSKDASSKDASSKDASSKDASSKDASSKDASGEDASGENDTSPPSVRRRPRIVLDGALILARETWFASAPVIPTRNSQESDLDYFLRVQRWRNAHDIPAEVYARVRPLPPRQGKKDDEDTDADGTDEPNAQESNAQESGVQESEADGADGETAAQDEATADDEEMDPEVIAENIRNRTVPSKDYRKPQYIDFRNPLLVNLFGKMATGLDRFTMTLEERYPPADELPTVNERRYTNEMILQFNQPESESPSDA